MSAPAGASFAGWTDEYGNTYPAGEYYTVTGNVIFTARWTYGGGPVGTAFYKVSYSAGEGGYGIPPASQDYASGTSITLPGQGNMSTSTGASFAGWTDDWYGGTYAAGDHYTVNGDVFFTAQWTYRGGPVGTADPFEGTWESVQSSVGYGVTSTVTASGGLYEQSMKGSGYYESETRGLARGTYTVEGTTVTMTFTQINRNMFSGASYLLYSPETWATFDDLAPSEQAQLREADVITITGGNTFIINNETYTKIGG
jgi:hypothetical protein